jgi:hypothetical protein
MFKRNALNQITVANIPLFGGWIPFIGFRDYPVDEQGTPIIADHELHALRSKPPLHVFFVLEWLIFFVALHIEEEEEILY